MSCSKALNAIRRLDLEITNRCNANCVFCPRDQLTQPLQDIKLKDACMIIHDVAKSAIRFGGLRLVNFGVFGEPTLNKDLPNIISYCKMLGLKTRISTNASILDSKLARALLEAGLDVCNISIESINKESYEQVRKGLKWETTKRNIIGFYKMKEKIRPKTVVVIYPVICEENKAESERIVNFWNRYSDSCRASKEIPIIRQDDRVEPWFLNMKNRFQRYVLSKIGVYSVTHCYDWFVVKADGSVVPCCLDYFINHPLGNIFEQSALEIFNGEKAQQFQDDLDCGVVPKICLLCRFLPIMRDKPYTPITLIR